MSDDAVLAGTDEESAAPAPAAADSDGGTAAEVYAACCYLRGLIAGDGRPHEEIAAQMGVSPGQFMQRFSFKADTVPPWTSIEPVFTVLGRDSGPFLERWGPLWRPDETVGSRVPSPREPVEVPVAETAIVEIQAADAPPVQGPAAEVSVMGPPERGPVGFGAPTDYGPAGFRGPTDYGPTGFRGPPNYGPAGFRAAPATPPRPTPAVSQASSSGGSATSASGARAWGAAALRRPARLLLGVAALVAAAALGAGAVLLIDGTRPPPPAPSPPVTSWGAIVQGAGDDGATLRSAPAVIGGTARGKVAEGTGIRVECGVRAAPVFDAATPVGHTSSVWLRTTEHEYASSLYLYIAGKNTIVNCEPGLPDLSLIPEVAQSAPPLRTPS